MFLLGMLIAIAGFSSNFFIVDEPNTNSTRFQALSYLNYVLNLIAVVGVMICLKSLWSF
ncbi:hypothetical protein [Priestia koreensis]|uniref:hypothetical protein n=1 Tax=Priestia koreensis TaxID=284581 RepID=UPI00203ACCDC|nr:hypothetical protein [Priestia koreensis]MCM3005871.1 hypothetical protein [Priestia koreensis]